MKVKELIERLLDLDQEAIIVTRGYKGGVTESSSVGVVEVALNVNTSWYYGEHEIVDHEEDEYTGYHRAKAVYLG